MKQPILLSQKEGFKIIDTFVLEVFKRQDEQTKEPLKRISHCQNWTKKGLMKRLISDFDIDISLSTVSRSLKNLKDKGLIYSVIEKEKNGGYCGLIITLNAEKVGQLSKKTLKEKRNLRPEIKADAKKHYFLAL
jgi:DNA-binding transcriptional ArsR family regulator